MSYQLGADLDQHQELLGEPRDQEARPRFRGLVASLIALLVMGVFVGGLWFAYMQGLRHAGGGGGGADVPLIRADQRPTRVKPDNPGGMEIPDRDKLIYTQKRATVEHLLPPPEKPMARPIASLPTSALPPETPPAIGSAIQPTSSQQSTTKPVLRAASTLAAPAKPTAPRELPATLGTRIQLSSVRSQDAARQEWDRIKRANADLLAGVSATSVRADLGEKGIFYRLQTAPIADADRICDTLKKRNIGCVIAR